MSTHIDKEVWQRVLDHDNFESRQKVKSLMKKNRELFTPKHNVSLDTQRQLAYDRLKLVCQNDIISIRDFDRNPQNIFTVHEALGMFDGSMTTKLTVQFNLFGGTVWRLGTEKHHTFIDKADKFEQVGCFGLTELGFGNNAIEMQTTATFDKKTDEWIINSPTLLSQKHWITNGALHAHWCVVFAQTFIDGKNEGVHAFLVRIRNDDMSVVKGVTIEDMGLKIGLNGVDNAKLDFKSVRVPRLNMLDKFSSVDATGKFSSSEKGRRQRFIAQADALLSGRLCIASMMIGTTKTVLTIATRYSLSRMCVGPSGKSDTAIGVYQLQQQAIAPLLANTIVMNIALGEAKEKYASYIQRMLKGEKGPAFAEAKLELLLLCCGLKPLLSWNLERVATICRERSGGQGYLAANMYGEAIAGAHAGMTAEGDNRVLWQKVAKEYMTGIAQQTFSNRKGISDGPMLSSSQKLSFSSPYGFGTALWLSHMLMERDGMKVEALQQAMAKAYANGMNNISAKIFDIWMLKEARLVQEVAEAFVERRVFESAADVFVNGVLKGNVIGLNILELYGISCVLKDIAWYVSHKKISPEEAGMLSSEMDKRIKMIGSTETIKNLTESFGVPDECLSAPIAGAWPEYNDPQVPLNGEVYNWHRSNSKL